MKEIRPTNDATAQKSFPDPPVSGGAPAKPARSRRWLAGILAIVLAFGVGFVPARLKAGRHADERDMARREVRLLQLESVAAAAALDARRGEYEPARQSASWFFTTLSAELDAGTKSSLSLAQQDGLRPLLTRRDDLITLLARNDPAAAERLVETYLVCRQVLRGG
jgi:hypothetical protein